LNPRPIEAQLNDHKPKTSSKIDIKNKRTATPKIWQESGKQQMKKQRKTQHPKLFNASSPLLVEFTFSQTSLKHLISKRVLPLCAYSLPLWQ
jgi:hypothetical protein